jgi:hypothetical protein
MPTKPQKNRKQIKVTLQANDHAEKVVSVLQALGKSVSKTSLVSDAILSIPLPSAVETKSQ